MAVRLKRLRDRGLSNEEVDAIDDDPSEQDVIHLLRNEADVLLDGAGNLEATAAELVAATFGP